MLSRRLLLAAAVTVGIVGGGVAEAGAADLTGRIGPATFSTGNGRVLAPAGRLTALGNLPTGGHLTPDGRFLWAIDSGHGKNGVEIMDVASGTVVQRLPLPGGYGQMVFASDGRTAYVSGEDQGSVKPDGPTKADAGDAIHVYSVNPATGAAAEQDPITLPATRGGTGQTKGLPPGTLGWPEGLALSPDNGTLVVALNQADQAVIVALPSRATTLVKVGAYPFGAAVDRTGAKAYVSNEYDGTVSVIDLKTKAVTKTIGVGGPSVAAGGLGDQNAHPEGLLADPRRDRLYVAVTNRDLIAVVDTASGTVVRYVDVGRKGTGLGTAPTALAIAPDGGTLYSANSGEDAIAAISLTDRVTGGAVAVQGTPGTATAGAVPPASRLRPFVKVRSVASIAKYRTRLAAAKRALAKARKRATTKKARVAAAKRYAKTVKKLRATLLVGPLVKACQGPTRAQESKYTAGVLKALAVRDATRRKVAKKRRKVRIAANAKARKTYGRSIRAAQRRLVKVGACKPTAGVGSPGVTPPGTGGTGGTGAIAGLPAFSLIGRIPTAAYPTAVDVSPDGRTLTWIAAKGLGAGPNPDYGSPFANSEAAPYGSYVLDKLLGRAGVLPTPTDVGVQALSAVADKQVQPANAVGAPAGTPVVGAGGAASTQIKHVFYIVRENRTYDQVFGSDSRGDGDPSLALFNDNATTGPTGGIAPNAHALATMFPLIDHFYANSEVSIDGHIITSGAYATDYVQRSTSASYGGRGRTYDFGFVPVTFPPKSFIFDQAVRQNVTFRNYGEAAAGSTPVLSDDGRPGYAQVIANTQPNYPNNVFIGCTAPAPAGCTTDSGVLSRVGGSTTGGAVGGGGSRFNAFSAAFNQQVATGTVPALNYMILPNDHTNGTKQGSYTPQALVADNDLALGQIVDLISHSSIWHESAIFVVEDDSQDGADHVDAHRMPAFVISPWARHGGAVVATRYDQYSAIRTMGLILGLAPLSLNDALATPMYDAFVSGAVAPDDTPYNAIQPKQSLTATNGAGAADLPLSAAMPFDQLDLVPQAVLDRILWHAVHGQASTPPPPGPNASPAEHARATGVLDVIARGGNARTWLAGHTEAEPGEAAPAAADAAETAADRDG